MPGTSAKLTAAGAAADVVPHSRSMDRQKSEDDMERMQEVLFLLIPFSSWKITYLISLNRI